MPAEQQRPDAGGIAGFAEGDVGLPDRGEATGLHQQSEADADYQPSAPQWQLVSASCCHARLLRRTKQLSRSGGWRGRIRFKATVPPLSASAACSAFSW